MEKKSNISLGGTIILLALYAQSLWTKLHFESFLDLTQTVTKKIQSTKSKFFFTFPGNKICVLDM